VELLLFLALSLVALLHFFYFPELDPPGAEELVPPQVGLVHKVQVVPPQVLDVIVVHLVEQVLFCVERLVGFQK
jgi:hypothetical protein